MSDEDRYIPGVPCWVDTSQPDAEAAVAFYGGLFGWEFEDVMPPGSERPYFVGRVPGGDGAAVRTLPAGSPAQRGRDATPPPSAPSRPARRRRRSGTRTCGWRTPTRRRTRCGRRAAR